MQQTEKYQLNLIETSDTFSPAALNENAQKTEAAIEAARAEAAADRAAGDDALEQRIITLEGKHAVGGYYIGAGDTYVVKLGFTPQIVLVYRTSTKFAVFRKGAGNAIHKVVEGGFQVGNSLNESYNVEGASYLYIAIG